MSHLTYYFTLPYNKLSLEQMHFWTSTDGYRWRLFWRQGMNVSARAFSFLYVCQPCVRLMTSLWKHSLLSGCWDMIQHPKPWIGLLGIENGLMDEQLVLILLLIRSCDLPTHSFIHSFSLPAHSYSRSQSISKQAVGGRQQNTLESLAACDFKKQKNV